MQLRSHKAAHLHVDTFEQSHNRKCDAPPLMRETTYITHTTAKMHTRTIMQPRNIINVPMCGYVAAQPHNRTGQGLTTILVKSASKCADVQSCNRATA